MKKIRDKIFNMILVIIAVVSFIISMDLAPPKTLDILFMIGLILFTFFVILITEHVAQIEKIVSKNEENFKRFEDLNKMYKEIEKIKLKMGESNAQKKRI